MPAVTAFAPAKINLALHVGPPRADGRHELASIAVFADAGDRVTIADGDAGFQVTGPYAPALAGEADNLVTRALASAPAARPAHVTLEKNLPVASGIGGGSADAAAALRAARLYFGANATDADLQNLARSLGSDVPACVLSRAAQMRGAGDDVTPIALPDLFAVLVNPNVPLATAAVYRRYDERGVFGDLAMALPQGEARAVVAALGAMRNDLELAACDLAPEIAAVLGALRRAPGVRLARMSGSGATCFGLVDEAHDAAALAAALSGDHPGWWIRAVRLGAIDAAARRV